MATLNLKRDYWFPLPFNAEQTGSVISDAGIRRDGMQWETNTGVQASKDSGAFSATGRRYYNETREFIKLDQSFRAALKEKGDMDGYNEYRIVEAMRVSANILLKCRPDKISVQLTEDGSIFYTLIIDNITVYFEHYPQNEVEDLDEVVLSIFKEKESILNVSGEMQEVIAAANGILGKQGIAIPELV